MNNYDTCTFTTPSAIAPKQLQLRDILDEIKDYLTKTLEPMYTIEGKLFTPEAKEANAGCGYSDDGSIETRLKIIRDLSKEIGNGIHRINEKI